MARGGPQRHLGPVLRAASSVSTRPSLSAPRRRCTVQIRCLHVDGRQRLSNVWLPSSSFAAAKEDANDAHSKLIRAGFIRQSHSGIFQMLPLGLRVQDKIEGLIDKHMQSLGASKLALSSLSAQTLWEKSGRLTNGVSELFRLTDRKDQGFLLCPTHEEEITSLVARNVKSHKDMPLKLYQITRKYRDELRPRHGLLRGREFIMKDLYTFDISVAAALESYAQVQQAYRNLFAELKLPILVAKASSGDMGGDLSHEYHLPTSLGEDNVISCTSCDFVANEELAEVAAPKPTPSADKHLCWVRITQDRKTLVYIWYPDRGVSVPDLLAVKSLVPDLDTAVEDPTEYIDLAEPGSLKVINLLDGRLKHLTQPLEEDGLAQSAAEFELKANHKFKSIEYIAKDEMGKPLDLLYMSEGRDRCPQCGDFTLRTQEAIELGHTFHLGTRYSEPLEARVEVPRALLDSPDNTAGADKQSAMVPLQMGCHGIGVTRMIGAVADHLHDEKGLNWPRLIAPYEVVVLANGQKAKPAQVEAAEAVFDRLVGDRRGAGSSLDVALDDRPLGLGWKLSDAELVGYPVVVVVGKHWDASREVEVRCRRLGVDERVGLDALAGVVHGLLERL